MLFWALFDQTDLESFEIPSKSFLITQSTGETLFALFYVVAILISLNMLIAMMASSFQQIAVSEQTSETHCCKIHVQSVWDLN